MASYHRKSCEVSRGVVTQVKGIMQDYERFKREKENILYGAQYLITGMPRGSDTSDPTAERAIKLEYIDTRLEAIDQTAFLLMAEKAGDVYEGFDPIKAYWNYDYFNYMHIRTKKFPEGPAYRTWNRFKDRFAEEVAKRLNLF